MIIAPIPSAVIPEEVGPEDVVYVLDHELRVVHTNQAWRAFAQANGGQRLLDDTWHGTATACFSGREKLRWQGVYTALLSGQLGFHEELLACPSPNKRRIYWLRITVHRDPDGAVALLVHHTRAIEGALPQAAHDVPSRYRQAVLERSIRPPGFDVAMDMAPLADVGGDLVWHHVNADGTTDLVMADVVGHGRQAAAVAVAVSRLLDEGAEDRAPVAEKVARLNQRLCVLHPGQTRSTRFATGLWLRLQPEPAALDACSFAHPGLIFSERGIVELPAGLPVGITTAAPAWPQLRLDLAALGHRALLFTDGITEQFDGQGDMFGMKRLETAFLGARPLPLPAMLETVRATLEAFRGDALIKDDRVLLGLQA